MSFYLYLCPSDSVSPCDFLVDLPAEYNLHGEWTCGLTEIHFNNILEFQNGLYVFCDVCDDTFVKNANLPLLRRIHSNKDSSSYYFHPIYYSKISRQNIQRLRIYILDENLKPFKYSGVTLWCTLHFLKRDI